MRIPMIRLARVALAMMALAVSIVGVMPPAFAGGVEGGAVSGERLGFGDSWTHTTNPDERLGFGDSWTQPRFGFGDSWNAPAGARDTYALGRRDADSPAAAPSFPNAVVIVLAMLAVVIGSATVAARTTAARRRKVAVAE